jgi:predicted metalloprotease
MTLRRVAPLALAPAMALVLVSGCAVDEVRGEASPASDASVDVSVDQFPVTGAGDEPIDQVARNALADLETFWQQAYPEYFGGKYAPLRGGYFSVDSENLDESLYPETGIGCAEQPTDPGEVAGNAFYDPVCDVVAYDRTLLQELADDHGRFLVPVVMAHEFGHAMQGRYGFAERSIEDETQADCLAGAWTRWVADGEAEHVALRKPELDVVVRGFLLLRDDVGSNPDDAEAHGSFFDRVSAFYEGYESGLAACRDAYGADRLFTAAQFDPGDAADQGNADFVSIVDWVGATLPAFYGAVFPEEFGAGFEAPDVATFDGQGPGCAGLEDRDLGYCAEDATVYLDESDLAIPAYDEIGDFALATAMALPYALAARDQAGLSVDDAAATRSAVCLTGWYQAQWYADSFADLVDARISPGDIDEAVQFLLQYGIDDRVFPDADASGFELVGAFRNGFLHGGDACDLAG